MKTLVSALALLIGFSGAGAYPGATDRGSFEGDWGDKSPLRGAGLYNIELDAKTPGT